MQLKAGSFEVQSNRIVLQFLYMKLQLDAWLPATYYIKSDVAGNSISRGKTERMLRAKKHSIHQ